MSVDTPNQVLEAIEGFATEDPVTRTPVIVQAGSTRIAADHWLARTYPQHFQPVDEHLTYEIEEATDEPGRRRTRPHAGPPRQKPDIATPKGDQSR